MRIQVGRARRQPHGLHTSLLQDDPERLREFRIAIHRQVLLPELPSENPILRQEIRNGILLSAIYSAGQDQEQQLKWLKLCLHVPPDMR